MYSWVFPRSCLRVASIIFKGVNTFTKETLILIVVIFILNLIGSSLSTMKTIFLARNIIRPTYFIVFIEAVIFLGTLSKVAGEDSISYIIALALGKTTGIWVGNQLEKRIALGILEISIFGRGNRIKLIADALREQGYSVTNYKGFGLNGKVRYEAKITIKRKEVSFLWDILKKYGYTDATMVVREINAVNGKISVSSHNPFIESLSCKG